MKITVSLFESEKPDNDGYPIYLRASHGAVRVKKAQYQNINLSLLIREPYRQVN
jgi:NurA-like 5'-3' nuclease